MFRRILIANRGEVVSRVMRTAKRMGIEVVAITTDADKDLSFLEGADEVINIGGTRAYLDGPAIIDAQPHSVLLHLDGVPLGKSTFSAQCEAAGITVGPAGATMRQMADKASARGDGRNGCANNPRVDGPLGTADIAAGRRHRLSRSAQGRLWSGGRECESSDKRPIWRPHSMRQAPKLSVPLATDASTSTHREWAAYQFRSSAMHVGHRSSEARFHPAKASEVARRDAKPGPLEPTGS